MNKVGGIMLIKARQKMDILIILSCLSIQMTGEN